MTDITTIMHNSVTESSDWLGLADQCEQKIRHVLLSRGYASHDGRIWAGFGRKVYLNLIDDISSICDLDALGPRDLVISDTWFNRPLNATALTVPQSWYGIFAHAPQQVDIDAVKDFSFLVNRIDAVRIHLLLRLGRVLGLDRGIVNFNCVSVDRWQHYDNNQARDNWNDQVLNLGAHLRTRYQADIDELGAQMPLRNHDLEHDKALIMSRLNLVVETYSGDDTIRLSEKTFAALVLPRPWQIYAGRFAVTHLRRMGFDVLDDCLDHGYERYLNSQDKVDQFIGRAQNNLAGDMLSQRSLRAAQHNQDLLFSMRRQWALDQPKWFHDIEKHLGISS